MKRDSSEEYLGKYEVVFGQHLESQDPQLSPKVCNVIREKDKIEQIFGLDSSPTIKERNEAESVPNNTTDDFVKQPTQSQTTVKAKDINSQKELEEVEK